MDTVPCSLKYAQAGPEQVQIIGCKVRTKHNCTSLVARGKFDSFLVPCGAELQRSSFPLSQAIAGGMASGSPASAVSPADSRTCAWRARLAYRQTALVETRQAAWILVPPFLRSRLSRFRSLQAALSLAVFHVPPLKGKRSLQTQLFLYQPDGERRV